MVTDKERAQVRSTIAKAKAIAESLVIGHVDDVDAMGDLSVHQVLKAVDGDEALLMALLRVLAGSCAAFATGLAARNTTRGTPEFQERSALLVRQVIERLRYMVDG